jgi:formiminotetrahydrofolate cyclodeaminase
MEMKRFLEKLSSDTPTPGGGSASALAGALSASLVSMTAGLSLEKGRLRKEVVERIRKEALAIQRRLLRAVDEDAKSYEAVLNAFRLPKNTEKERLVRTKAIQKAYRKATIIPQLVCQHAILLLEDSKALILKGNPNAITDAGVAAFLADAALAGGLLNIGVNLDSVTDRMFVKRMNLLMKRLKRKRNYLMRGILNILMIDKGDIL